MRHLQDWPFPLRLQQYSMTNKTFALLYWFLWRHATVQSCFDFTTAEPLSHTLKSNEGVLFPFLQFHFLLHIPHPTVASHHLSCLSGSQPRRADRFSAGHGTPLLKVTYFQGGWVPSVCPLRWNLDCGTHNAQAFVPWWRRQRRCRLVPGRSRLSQ